MTRTITTRYYLGPVALDYCQFRWPLYRGTRVRRIQIDQGIGKMAALSALPRITTLRIECARPGGGQDVLTIQGVRILEIVAYSAERCYVVIADARDDLGKFISAADINIEFQDGLLDGTRFLTLGRALAQTVDGAQPATAKPQALPLAQRLRDAPSGLPLAGSPMPAALERVLDGEAVDVVADPESGRLRYTDRSDDVPDMPEAVWLRDNEPGWLAEERVVFGLPDRVANYYTERHAVRVENEDTGRRTYAARSQAPMLRNVFAVGERFLTLQELAVYYGQPAVAGNVAFVAWNILRKNWTAPLQRDGSADRDNYIATVQRDFRRLWQIVVPEGQQGMWTDPVFGRFDLSQATVDPQTGLPDYSGVVYSAPVECDWAEVFGTISPTTQGQPTTTILGVSLGENYNRATEQAAGRGDKLPTAPLEPRWVSEDDMVFRLRDEDGNGDSQIYVGNFVTPPRLDWLPGGPQDGFWNIGKTPEDSLVIRPEFELAVYVTLTRRVPNSRDRWHRETVDTSGLVGDAKSNQKIPLIELEVPDDIQAYRDVPDGNALPDGFGPVVNGATLKRDAERRARLLVDELTRGVEGQGIAIGLSGVRTLEGAIEEIGIDVNENIVTTVVTVGNLASRRDRSRKAFARTLAREFKMAGKADKVLG